MARTGMLIRKAVAEVFEAFINPDITAEFWFTKGSGRLETGKQVRGHWERLNVLPVAGRSAGWNSAMKPAPALAEPPSSRTRLSRTSGK